MKQKVFCQNCKFFSFYFFNRDKEHLCKFNKLIDEKTYVEKIMLYATCKEVNPNGNCKDYKKKWWKI